MTAHPAVHHDIPGQLQPYCVAGSPASCAEALDASGWLSGMHWPQLTEIARYLVMCHLPAGVCLFEEGDTDVWMGILVEGQVRVEKHNDRQQLCPIRMLGRGKVFGELSLIDHQARSARIVVVAPTRLLILTRQGLDGLIEDCPRLGAQILYRLAVLMSARLRDTSGRLVEFLSPL